VISTGTLTGPAGGLITQGGPGVTPQGGTTRAAGTYSHLTGINRTPGHTTPVTTAASGRGKGGKAPATMGSGRGKGGKAPANIINVSL